MIVKPETVIKSAVCTTDIVAPPDHTPSRSRIDKIVWAHRQRAQSGAATSPISRSARIQEPKVSLLIT